jgi:hypothetical protein
MLDAMTSPIEVVEKGRVLAYSFEDMLKYHGPGSPGGVAHAFKVLQRALPLLDPDGPPERREIELRTAFGGPGARDGFELVTRAVTGDRYVVDSSLALPDRGRTRANFVFVLTYRDSEVTLLLREGYVTEEFIDMVRKPDRSAEDDARLDELKQEMATRVMSSPAEDVYEVAAQAG